MAEMEQLPEQDEGEMAFREQEPGLVRNGADGRGEASGTRLDRSGVALWLMAEASHQVSAQHQRTVGLQDKLNRAATMSATLLVAELAILAVRNPGIAWPTVTMAAISVLCLVRAAIYGCGGMRAVDNHLPGSPHGWFTKTLAVASADETAEAYLAHAKEAYELQQTENTKLGQQCKNATNWLVGGLACLGLGVVLALL